MKIAIIGSRNFKNMGKVTDFICSNVSAISDVIITGGAIGVDKVVEEYCRKLGILCQVIKPINPEDKISYLFRNVEIITLADKIIAFWDGKSKGTKFVIDYAKLRGIEIDVIMED